MASLPRRPHEPRRPGGSPARGLRVLGALLLAAVALMVIDTTGGSSSPLTPLRSAVGSVVGPAETATAALARPFASLGGMLDDNQHLRRQVATLTAENSQLRSANELAPLQQSRLREFEALTRTADRTGYTLVPARVVGIGPAQSFRRTVTIDAGSSSGVRADMTVLNGDGLVGRVVSATADTATVLLIVDPGSVVGARLGSDLELGSITGQGSLSGDSALRLDLVDNAVTPARGDVVATWGSSRGVPYVAGIPIGKVTQVYSSPRNLTVHATVTPFVNFGALDLVGVVVPDRGVRAGGARITPKAGAR